MKKSTKGILAFAFLGGIMVTSGVVIAIPGIAPDGEDPDLELTGTPADNYPPMERPRFCGSGDPQSTRYVQEFAIPTDCTNPLAIVADYDGNIWVAQTNTGNLAKFDPTTLTFTEYDNPIWPPGGRSMIWGIDYAPDGSVWFTDETFDSVWKFSTLEERYQRLAYPTEGDSLPQKIKIEGSQVIINDFTGNKITFLDPSQSSDNVSYTSLPSPIGNSTMSAFSSDFAIDADDNIWYTNWMFQQGGLLVKYDYNGYQNTIDSRDDFLPLLDFIEVYELPRELYAANGVEISSDGLVWIADTASSSFFSFNPITKEFVQYVTAEPMLSTFGNQTGVIKTPISRPYWIQLDDQNRLVLNSQNANNISVMDPISQSLVEYHVPSKNPYWGDCDPGTGLLVAQCGLAQVFDFTIYGDKIWFSEWVENKIGVVDTSKPLPLSIDLESNEISLTPGESKHFNFVISPKSESDLMGLSLITTPASSYLDVELTHNSPRTFQLDFDAPRPIHTNISATPDAKPGTYKILLGVQSSDIAISKFVTVTIE